MSNSFNNSGMIVNPILATFPADEVNIQPYWMVVLGLIANQLFQRIWHQFKYHTCFTTLEIAGLIRIFQQRLANRNSNEAWSSSTVVSSKKTTDTENNDVQADKERLEKLQSMIVVDFFDAISCLLTLGHAIWYCVIQSTCPNSSTIATPWNCYNALGYRLINYIFVSYFTAALNLAYKAYALGLTKVMKTDAEKGSFAWVMHYATLIVIGISLLFTTGLLLPFIITNLLPMFFIYIWMAIIYVAFVIYLTVSGFQLYGKAKQLPAKIKGEEQTEPEKESQKQEFCSFMFSAKEMPQVAISMLMALVISTFPILLSIFFNYSQFYYFGETYLKSIENDHLSRDTLNYFNLLRSSTDQILHMVLNFI